MTDAGKKGGMISNSPIGSTRPAAVLALPMKETEVSVVGAGKKEEALWSGRFWRRVAG